MPLWQTRDRNRVRGNIYCYRELSFSKLLAVTTQKDYAEQAETTLSSIVFPEDNQETENTIVYGPALSGKSTLAMEAVASAVTPAQSPIFVTTSDTAEQFRDRLDPLLPAGTPAAETLLVDASDVTQAEGVADGWTLSIGSPADLTGLGIALSKGFDRLDEMGFDGGHILVDNLTTLLVYTDFDRVFRFVDDLNHRAVESGRTVVYILDDDAVGEQNRSKLLQLFSRAVEVTTDDEATQFRRRGETNTDWYEYDQANGGEEQ